MTFDFNLPVIGYLTYQFKSPDDKSQGRGAVPVGMQGERYFVTTRAPLPVIALAIARALAEVVLENSRDLGGKDTGPGAWSLDPALGLDLAGNTRGVVAVLCASCRSRCTSFDV